MPGASGLYTLADPAPFTVVATTAFNTRFSFFRVTRVKGDQ